MTVVEMCVGVAEPADAVQALQSIPCLLDKLCGDVGCGCGVIFALALTARAAR